MGRNPVLEPLKVDGLEIFKDMGEVRRLAATVCNVGDDQFALARLLGAAPNMARVLEEVLKTPSLEPALHRQIEDALCRAGLR